MNLQDQSVVRAYQEAFMSEHGRETSLSPERILEIVRSIEGEDEDADNERLEAMLSAESPNVPPEETKEETEEQKTASQIARKQRDRADTAASKLDTAFYTELNLYIGAKETVVNGAVILAEKHLRRLYSESDLKSMPIPDSTVEDNPSNPDKFSIRLITPDGTTTKKMSFWGEMFSASRLGQKIALVQDGFKAIEDQTEFPKTEDNDVLEAWEKYKKTVNAKERRAQKRLWEQRVTVGRNVLKRAKRILDQWFAIEEHCPKIGVVLLTADNGEIANTPTPIRMYTKGKEAETDCYAVPKFLSFDPIAAAKVGGTLADLINTKKQQAHEEPQRVKPVTLQAGTPVTEIEPVFAMMLHWFEEGDHFDKLHKMLLDEKADDLVLTMDTLIDKFETVFINVAARATKIRKQREKNGEKAAA